MQIASSTTTTTAASRATGATSTATSTTTATTRVVSPSRDIPQGQLYVGALALANGTYYQTSAGGGVSYTISGQRVNVVRINNSQPYSVYITAEDGTALGWVESSALQVVSST